MNPTARQDFGMLLGRIGVLGMAGSMPISRAMFNTSALLMLVGWLLSGNARDKWAVLKSDPVAWACAGFYSIIAITALSASTGHGSGLGQLLNYSKILYIPLILTLITDPVWKQRAWIALISGMVFTLVVLWLDVWLEVPGTRTYGKAPGSIDSGVFQQHIAQGMVLAFLAAYSLHRLLMPGRVLLRMGWLVIVCAIAVAVFFINDSRAAQISLVAAIILTAFTHLSSRLRWMGIALSIALLVALGLGSAGLQAGFKEAWQEAESYEVDGHSTSVGARLQAWRASAGLIAQAPILGHGPGAYRALAHEHFKESTICDLAVCEQPHNQFILTTVESGMVGLVALLAWLLTPLWTRKQPRSTAAQLYLPLLGIFIGTAMFDSSLAIRPQAFFVVITLGVLMASRHHGSVQRSSS